MALEVSASASNVYTPLKRDSCIATYCENKLWLAIGCMAPSIPDHTPLVYTIVKYNY